MLLTLDQLERLESLKQLAKRDPRWAMALGHRNAGYTGMGAWHANHGAILPAPMNPLETSGVGLLDPQAYAVLPAAANLVINPPRAVNQISGMGALPAMRTGALSPAAKGAAPTKPKSNSDFDRPVPDSTKASYTSAVKQLDGMDPGPEKVAMANSLRRQLDGLPDWGPDTNSYFFKDYDSWLELSQRVDAARMSYVPSGAQSPLGPGAGDGGGGGGGFGSALDSIGSFLSTISGPAADIIRFSRNQPSQPSFVAPPPDPGFPWGKFAIGVGVAAGVTLALQATKKPAHKGRSR